MGEEITWALSDVTATGTTVDIVKPLITSD